MGSLALHAFLTAASLLFAVATLLYLAYLRWRKNDTGFWASFFALMGWIALSVGAVVRGALLGQIPLGSFSDSLLLLVWFLASSFFVVEQRFGLKAGGAFVLPTVTAGVLYATLTPAEVNMLLPILRSPWVSWHVGLVFAGYATFALAAVAGLLYLLQERELKSKRLTFMHFSLPSLGALERLAVLLVAVGFPCLTLGILTGALWSRQVWGSYIPWDPKVVWTLATWLFYCGALVARRVWGWRGRRIALFTVVGFLAVIANYLGITWLWHGVHRF